MQKENRTEKHDPFSTKRESNRNYPYEVQRKESLGKIKRIPGIPGTVSEGLAYV